MPQTQAQPLAQDAPLSPGHKRWRVNVFAATWMSYAGFYFCRQAFGVVKPKLKGALQIDDFQLAHIWTAYLIAYMLGQFLAGWIGTKAACRTLLLGGMGLTLVCNVVFGQATLMGPAGYWPFLTLMILNGFAQATGWPGNIGTMAHWFRRQERGTIIGFWGTCYQLGSAWAKSFAAFMLAFAGMAWSFWGAALVMLGVWTLFYLLQRDRPEDVGLPAIVEEIESTGDGAEPAANTADGRWTLSVIRSIAIMGATYFSFKFIRYAVNSWSTVVMKSQFNLDPEVSGHISTAFDYVGFAGVLFAGWVSDRFFAGRRSTITFAMSLGMVLAVGFLATAGMSSPLLFGIALALVGFALFGPDSLLSGVGAIDVGSKRKAVLAAGIVNGTGQIGAVLQEEIIGYLKAYHSLDAVFQLLIGVSLLGAVGTGVLWWLGRAGKSRF